MYSEPIPAPIAVESDGAEGESAQEPQIVRRSRFLGGLVYHIVSLLFRTLHVTFENREGLCPPAGGAIYVTWHGRTLIPANVTRDQGWWALISLSRDGEIQNHIFRRFGFQTARGSTGRGGIRGALRMARKVKEGGVLVMTPDGPRGPTHKVQLGVILMAEKSGAPIIPVGISTNRRWLLRSWDSYLIPKPFARAYFLVGQPIHIPPGLDEAGRAACAAEVEVAINRLEKRAEELAGFTAYPVEWRSE